MTSRGFFFLVFRHFGAESRECRATSPGNHANSQQLIRHGTGPVGTERRLPDPPESTRRHQGLWFDHFVRSGPGFSAELRAGFQAGKEYRFDQSWQGTGRFGKENSIVLFCFVLFLGKKFIDKASIVYSIMGLRIQVSSGRPLSWLKETRRISCCVCRRNWVKPVTRWTKSGSKRPWLEIKRRKIKTSTGSCSLFLTAGK